MMVRPKLTYEDIERHHLQLCELNFQGHQEIVAEDLLVV